jgi:hypothetical protein
MGGVARRGLPLILQFHYSDVKEFNPFFHLGDATVKYENNTCH